MTRSTYKPAVAISGTVILRGDPMAHEYPVPIVPLSVSVDLNGHREADSFDATFDAKGFPFHVDDIRSMSVEVYAFERRSIDEPMDLGKVPRNLLVAGRSEENGLELSDDGDTFSVSGKDYTETFTRLPHWDPRVSVAVGGSLVDAIQRIVDMKTKAEPASRVLTVRYIEAPGEGAVRGGRSRIPMVSGDGTRAKGLTWPDGTSYWDVISDLCARSGKRVFVSGLDVVISTPQDLSFVATTGEFIDNAGATGSRAPSIWHMAWGKNISRLAITRRGAGEKTPQVVIKASGPGGKTLVGMFPLEFEDAAQKTTKISKKGKVTTRFDGESLVRLVHNVGSVDELNAMARTAWFEISRGESEIEFETSDLSDLNDRPLLQLRPADPMHIVHDPLQRSELGKLTIQEKYKALVAGGVEAHVAIAIAENFDSLERWNRPYYTRAVSMDWDAGGMEFKVRAANYLGIHEAEAAEAA